MNIFHKLLQFLFPTRCIDCGKEGYWICGKCLRSIKLAERPREDWITSVWSYKDKRIKKLLWLLKFHGKRDVARDLGLSMYEHFLEEISEKILFEGAKKIVLAPIPLSKKKMDRRGYNQSAVLARELEARSGGALTLSENVLKKIKDGRTQNSIKNRRERFENIRGNFAVQNPERIRGLSVIIVDDITTTHATLIEAKRALEEAGAASVTAFTAAH